MTNRCYQKLLEYSNQINPIDLDFPNKTIRLLLETFGFPDIELHIFADGESNDLCLPNSKKTMYYHKETVLLKNQQLNCMGTLCIYQNKDTDSHILKESRLVKEIGKILENALEIHLNYYKLKVDYSLVESLLSHLSKGIILCNSNFKIVHINEEAMKIMETIENELPKCEAEVILKNKILPVYLNTGSTQYFLPLSEYHLQVAIKNLIINGIEINSYITYYQITLNCIDRKNESEWLNFLKNKKLTNRECEIANLMKLGYTNDEMAKNLQISINTMKRHRESIYKKLDINRINQLNILYENY